jgi:hypothetical protein
VQVFSPDTGQEEGLGQISRPASTLCSGMETTGLIPAAPGHCPAADSMCRTDLVAYLQHIPCSQIRRYMQGSGTDVCLHVVRHRITAVLELHDVGDPQLEGWEVAVST